MSIEIIDLTNTSDSPPSTPKSSSNLHQHINHHQHQTTLLVPLAPPHTSETPQLATGWLKPGIQHSRVTTPLIPLPETNTVQLSKGVRLRVPWSQFEHDLFLMGLIEYGKGRWSKIAKHYVCSKTPEQVRHYAASFFKHLPPFYVHGFKRKKQIVNGNNFVSNRNINSSSTKETLTLLPYSTPYHQIATNYGGKASSSNKNYGLVEMMKDGPSTSMALPNADYANGKVDLELRLGLY